MQEPSNYNSHKEFRKTITLISGILLLFAGIFLLYIGTSAKGTVDFSSNLIKGKIETGSAGMLALFIGLIIVYTAIYEPKDNNRNSHRISAIVKMVLNCNRLVLIIGMIVIISLLPLVYYVETLRLHLIGLIAFIIILIFIADKKS